MIDYISTLSIDFGLILPELLLLIAASVILMVAFMRRLSRLSPLIGVIGLGAALLTALAQLNTQKGGFAGMVTVDPFGALFKVLFAFASLLSLAIALRYLESNKINHPEFYALLLISTMGMMVMATSTDLVVIFLGLEIMSLPLYVMAGLARRSLESNEAGIKYFIMGAFATGFLLMGIAFIYGAAETTNLRRIVTDFAYVSGNAKTYLYAGAGLLLIGFGFKVAAVPFHSWVPDVYQGAPTPVTAFFSVAPKAAGFAALLRIFNFGLADLDAMVPVLWVLAALTMSVGNILALRQDNVKRMLAYSSISHAGYILVALTAGGSEAVSAAMFYLIAYTLFNLGGFAVVTLLEQRTGCRSDFSELTGLSKTNPYLTAVLALFMFALSGFPPTVGFLGKFYIFAAAVNGGFIWLTVIGVMNSFVSVYYYLRVVKVSYFDQPAENPKPAAVTPALFLVLVVAAIGTLGLGLFPDRILELSRSAFFALM
ncbi:MAG: NADH-quinone oxidoreductase subunit N [Candidatus Zixiibacteriota bacterium]